MSELLMGFVGDMLVHRDRPQDAFGDVHELLQAPQIMFGNLEGSYSDHPHAAPGATIVVGAPAHNLNVFSEVGFDVLSMASNHVLDLGYEAMLETRARLRSHGVKTCGVGESIADAHEPAIVESNGIRVAFLAYCSVFPIGYEARWNAPGLAPMRAYNYLRDTFPSYYPGGPAALITMVTDEADLGRLAADIRRARDHADIVVTSFHWGEYSRPYYLTEHERRTARHSIDQGADLVVGHHHHTLRGMEWYKGKPIMYGLGHFVADLRLELGEEIEQAFKAQGGEDSTYMVGPREGWPLLPLHKDARMSVMAWATVTRAGVTDIGFIPCRLTPDGVIHPLRSGSAESDEVVAYLDKCNTSQGLQSSIIADRERSIAGYNGFRVVPRQT